MQIWGWSTQELRETIIELGLSSIQITHTNVDSTEDNDDDDDVVDIPVAPVVVDDDNDDDDDDANATAADGCIAATVPEGLTLTTDTADDGACGGCDEDGGGITVPT